MGGGVSHLKNSIAKQIKTLKEKAFKDERKHQKLKNMQSQESKKKQKKTLTTFYIWCREATLFKKVHVGFFVHLSF